jgi:hypothetical protein
VMLSIQMDCPAIESTAVGTAFGIALFYAPP